MNLQMSTVKLHMAPNLQYAHRRGCYLSGYAPPIVLGLLFTTWECSWLPAAILKGNTPLLRS